MMKIPVWALYIMLLSSLIGTVFLVLQMHHEGWPVPWEGRDVRN